MRGAPSTFSFPFLGARAAEWPEQLELLVWFAAPTETPEGLFADWVVEASERGVVVLSTENGGQLGPHLEAALTQAHARAKVLFAVTMDDETSEAEPSAWGAWSATHAGDVTEHLSDAHRPWRLALAAAGWVRLFLPAAGARRLGTMVLERLAPVLEAGEGLEDVDDWGELVAAQPKARRLASLAKLPPALQLAYGLTDDDRLDEVLARGLTARLSEADPDDVRTLADRALARARATVTASASPAARRAMAREGDEWRKVARACLTVEGACTAAQRALSLTLDEALDDALVLLPAAAVDAERFSDVVATLLAVAARLSHRAAVKACLDEVGRQPELLDNAVSVANVLGELLATSDFERAATVARAHLAAERPMTAALHTNAILAFASARDTGPVARQEADRLEALLAEDDGTALVAERDLRGSAYAWLAQWCCEAGELERALRHLRGAQRVGYPDLSIALMSASFRPLANHPEVAELRRSAAQAAAGGSQTEPANPRDWWAVFSRGLGRHNAGDLAGAMVDYERVLALNPSYPDVYINVGNIHWARDGNLPEAIAWYDKALALAPRQVTARLNRAEARLLTGNASGAAEDATVALEADPRSAQAYLLRAVARFEQGHLDTARADARAGDAIAPARTVLTDPRFEPALRELLSTRAT